MRFESTFALAVNSRIPNTLLCCRISSGMRVCYISAQNFFDEAIDIISVVTYLEWIAFSSACPDVFYSIGLLQLCNRGHAAEAPCSLIDMEASAYDRR